MFCYEKSYSINLMKYIKLKIYNQIDQLTSNKFIIINIMNFNLLKYDI